jgi:OmpA-OmpF porin, OOP family
MRVDAILMGPKKTRLALLLLAGLSIGCGTVRHPALESAREAYQKARQDPAIVRHAAVALDRAGRTLEEADRLWTKEQDILEVEHLAYIAEKRVEIARVTAQRRLAADEIQQVRSPRP